MLARKVTLNGESRIAFVMTEQEANLFYVIFQTGWFSATGGKQSVFNRMACDMVDDIRSGLPEYNDVTEKPVIKIDGCIRDME